MGDLCDYRTYHLSAAEWAKHFLTAAGAAGAAAYVFYRSLPVFIGFLPLAALWPFYLRRRLGEQRRETLRLQFKEGILALASALESGYSVENAFAASLADIRDMYGEDGMITREFSYIVQQLRMNRTVESLLSGFAARSGVEEIENFAEIFAVSKRSRGGVGSVIAHVTRVISQKIEVREEIRNMTAEKQFEQRIMNMIPFFIVIYVDSTSPGFFDCMYTTVIGRIVMTACLGVYLVSLALAGHFLRIEI